MRKNEKGVTLMALVITVIVILILTGMLIYDSKDSINVRNMEKLYNDIETLRDKVNEYDEEYGALPTAIKYSNTDTLQNMESILNNYEKNYDDFYIIDLEKLKGVTLNYGRDYDTLKSMNEGDSMSAYTDVYVINSITHNIFYIEGIEIKQNQVYKKYFTDYTEPDNTEIDLRYIDGILIPDGYSFEKRDEDENVVIKNSTGSEEYTWVKVISEVDKVPDSITLSSEQNETDFINSVNEHDGYFVKTDDKNKSSGKTVIYL